MLGGVAAVIPTAVVVMVSAIWVDGITKSDERCNPGADCESCSFPCENHNNKPSSNANTNVSMMGDTFKYAASLAGSLGYSMEDTAIATGLMANSGIKATQAGTSLRAILTRMAAPTKESQAALDALGISMDDRHGNMKSFMEIMEDLRGSFGTLKISQDEFEQSLNRLDTALHVSA